MYLNKLAVAIKSGNKVLREFEDQVFLPFNSTYSIFIKNKNSVRASVKIEIDGTDVTQDKPKRSWPKQKKALFQSKQLLICGRNEKFN